MQTVKIRAKFKLRVSIFKKVYYTNNRCSFLDDQQKQTNERNLLAGDNTNDKESNNKGCLGRGDF